MAQPRTTDKLSYPPPPPRARKVAEMLKFPRKEERKNDWKEGRRKESKEGRKERKGKEREKGKETEWGGLLGKEKRVCKNNEGTWLATRKKNIFLSPGNDIENRLVLSPIYQTRFSNLSVFNRSFLPST